MMPISKFQVFFLIFTVSLVNSHRLACSSKDSQQPPNRVNTTKILASLRQLMKKTKIQALLVESGDEHQSEFVTKSDKRRQRISGFSGSAGDVIITRNKAALWTDGRYHIQADEQLDCNWILMRVGDANVPTQAQWLNEELPKGSKIGTNSKIVSAEKWIRLKIDLKKKHKKLKLVALNNNLVDEVVPFAEDVPKQGYVLDKFYTGLSWIEKVKIIRTKLKELKADAMIVTALDEVAWLLNIRGWDIPFSSFIKSYVFLSKNNAVFYVDYRKIKGNITNFFIKARSEKLVIKNYKTVYHDLPKLFKLYKKILVPSACGISKGASRKIYSLTPKRKRIFKCSPIINLKAKKNPTEINGMKNAHIEDAVALCNFFEHFESSINKGKIWYELEVATKVDEFRYKQQSFVTPSFGTIAAFGPHSAVPHYVATLDTSSVLNQNSTLMLDSGGQYYSGTTDVTRTIHLGTPSKKEKEVYTRVLIGSIDLSNFIFPSTLETTAIDVIARAPLWSVGYDVPHGTGHGIGAFLSVHESPINVRYNGIKSVTLEEGFFLSNEPGIYLKEEFGVRLENIMRVVKKFYPKEKKDYLYLGFEDITLVPYDLKLIDYDLLNNNHIRWLNNYHAKIQHVIGSELKRQNATETYKWMMRNTPAFPLKTNDSLS